MPHDKLARMSGCHHATATRGSLFEHDPTRSVVLEREQEGISEAVRKEKRLAGVR